MGVVQDASVTADRGMEQLYRDDGARLWRGPARPPTLDLASGLSDRFGRTEGSRALPASGVGPKLRDDGATRATGRRSRAALAEPAGLAPPLLLRGLPD